MTVSRAGLCHGSSKLRYLPARPVWWGMLR